MVDKLHAYLEREVEPGLTRGDFIKMISVLVGLELTGAAHIADVIINGGKSKILADVSRAMGRPDTPDDVKGGLATYVPLVAGLTAFSLLTRHSVNKFNERGGSRREFLKLVGDIPKNFAWSLVTTGFGFFAEPTVVGAAAENYFRGERVKKEKFDQATEGIGRMFAETMNSGKPLITLDNYQGEARENILKLTHELRGSLNSPDGTSRINAKQLFAWACIAPTGDRGIYEKYLQKLLPIDPTKRLNEDEQKKISLFAETLDTITGPISQTYADETVANALMEASFRTMALVIDPDANLWQGDEFTLKSTTFSTPQMVNRKSSGMPVYTPFRAGDTPDMKKDIITFTLNPHNP